MSTHAYLVLLLFLCISLHACNARHLNPLDKKKLEKKPHLSIKIDDKIGFDTSPKKLTEGDDNKRKSEFVGDSEKTKNKRSTNKRVGNSRVSSQAESLVSVSLRVPHKKNKKRSEKQIPWFTLDYSPPKTHPPSHN